MSTYTDTTPAVPPAPASAPTSSTTAAKPRGPKRTDRRHRYTGRQSTRSIRRTQNTMWAVRGRDLTVSERGALAHLSNVVDRFGGGR